MSQVDAESEAAIFLPYQNNSTCPWATGMPDGSYVQHVLVNVSRLPQIDGEGYNGNDL